MLPGMELMACPELAVPKEVMHHIVQVESSRNPYAIGVVGGRLARQPKTLDEALATVRMLEQKGFNFSVGIAQVNRYNLDKYGLDSYTKAFTVCPNLQAGARILAECYRRHQDWGKSFSCYYSGNAVTGFRHGYVQKVFASMAKGQAQSAAVAGAIPVWANPQRRVVPVTSMPLRQNPRIETGANRVVLDGAPAAITDPAFASGVMPAASMAATPVSVPAASLPEVPAESGADASTAPVRLQLTQSAPAPTVPVMAPADSGGDTAFVF